jgi:hypothetical protein
MRLIAIDIEPDIRLHYLCPQCGLGMVKFRMVSSDEMPKM